VSNLIVAQKVCCSATAKNNSPLKNPWSVLRTTNQKICQNGGNPEIDLELERIFAFARTHFSKNQQIRTDVNWKKEDNLTQNKPRRSSAKG